ncbi:hypothetical protein ACHAWF_017337 [Thalassiosira exigua]
MGRKLRSGRQIASLSPPNKRVDKAGQKPKVTETAAGKRARTAAPKQTAKKITSDNKGSTKPPKASARTRRDKQESSESEDEEGAQDEPGSEGDSRESDDDDDVKNVSPAPVRKSVEPTRKNQKKKDIDEESSGSDSEEDLSSNDGSDDQRAPKKGKSLEQKGSSGSDVSEDGSESDSDSSEDEVEGVAPVPIKKKPGSTEESEDESSDESDDDVDKVAPAPLQKSKTAVKKGDSSDEDDDGSEEESSSDDGDENEKAGFTDENANWLKPKKMKLMSSDEDEGGDDDEFDAASDDDELLEVERQSRLIDAEMKLEQEEAESELRRTIAQQTSVFHLPTAEELEDDENRVVPPSELRARIEDVLEVLADFKTRREPGRSRSEYIERLAHDMAELFGYLQELVDYFLSMFGPNECFEFLEASDKNRPLVVRVNTLKARRKDLAAALMKRGVRLDPLAAWSKVGLKIYESNVPIGATPEYLAGHYMLQSAASMCPVMALGPQPGDRVMDMSAAPGGKTSYISQLMRNKGVVIANDLKPERQKATVANLHRLGVRNVVTCCYDGRKIGAQMRNSFDRILLDAPCSGLGVISRDPSVKVQRTIPDVQRCAHLQKELLVAAIDALNHRSKKGGGFMVYSTCSVAVAENEEVVNYLLSKRDVKLVDTGLDFGKPGFTRFEHKRFHPSVALTRRFYPHVHNMDGFYVAKIQKLSDKRKGEEDKKQTENASDEVKADAVKEEARDGKKSEVEAGKAKQHPGAKKKAHKKGKKRGNAPKDGADNDEPNMPRKKAKMSYPNLHAQKPQKKKTNAKMTKPRRMKHTGM